MMEPRHVTNCPACGSTAFTQVGAIASSFPGSDGDSALRHPDYVIRECEVCGLLYKSQTPAPDVLHDYYSALDFGPFELSYLFPTDNKLLEILRGLPPGARILDYGCSTGRILDALGSRYARYGIEVNAEAATVAAQRGLEIISSEALPRGEHRAFDAIVVSDVFEHLLDPTETLRLLASHIKPGGMLLMVTGLADSIVDRDWIGEHWYFRVFGHLHMMTLKHLHWLCHNIGLECAKTYRCCHYKRQPVRWVTQMIQAGACRQFRRHPKGMVASLFRRLPFVSRAETWANLPATDQFRDHIVVVARKPCDGPRLNPDAFSA